MSGARKSSVGAPAFHTSSRCGSGPPLGYSPGLRPVRFSAAFTYIGNVVARLARHDQRLDEARVVPGGENLRRPIRHRRTPAPRCPTAFAPFFCQRSRSSGSSFSPRAASARMSSAGTGRGEQLVGHRAALARDRQHADLVLHLHHEHGVLVAVDAFQRYSMKRRERARVGVARVRRKRREDLDARSVGELRARKTLRVALHPGRHVRGHAVLPRAEPQDHELQIVRARIAQQRVDARSSRIFLRRAR